MIRIFSKRYEDAIFEKKLKLSLPTKLRQRIWFVLEKHNFTYKYQPDPMDGWTETTNILSQLEIELCRRYGVEKLMALKDYDKKVNVDLKGFVKGSYPSQVFDTIELFYHDLPPEFHLNFQKDINNIFEEEHSEWRLLEGQFFKIDSEFLSLHVLSQSYELLKSEGFEGALDEFKRAHQDLSSGDLKGAIHNACNSFESTLKTILGRESGNSSILIKELLNTDFYDDIPKNVSRSFGDQVLMSLPFIRNRLGGHGQGQDVVEVPKSYAELTVHLAGSFINFLIKRHLASSTKAERKQDTQDTIDDSVPF